MRQAHRPGQCVWDQEETWRFKAKASLLMKQTWLAFQGNADKESSWG